MAWPNPFYRKTPNTRVCWGYRFELSPEHLTLEQSQPLKHSYDLLGEQVLDRLNELSPPLRKDLPRNNSQFSSEFKQRKDKDEPTAQKQEPKGGGGDEGAAAAADKPPPRDLYALLQTHRESDELLQRFWAEVTTIPEWVDWDQIQRGQDVFYRYGAANLTGLAFQSLLGGMGAARVVETLARTGGFSTKMARGRLFETTQHILQCTKSLESIKPGGEGFASTIRVRLLHAAVRNRILKLAATKPEYYDMQAWGVPINDLDSMATIATFSSQLVFIGLTRQGIYLSKREIEDYIALWRYIAYLVGSPTEHFSSASKAKKLIESLLMNEIQPTHTSQILANNIIKSLHGQPPTYVSENMLVASARWLNGNDLCDALNLGQPGIYYWALMAGQCMFFSFFCYVYRAVPSWDKRKIEFLKRAFYHVIVNTKYGLQGKESLFEFKYVPEYSTVTELGICEEEAAEYSDVETRNRNTFLVALLVLGVTGWGVWKVAGMAVRWVW